MYFAYITMLGDRICRLPSAADCSKIGPADSEGSRTIRWNPGPLRGGAPWLEGLRNRSTVPSRRQRTSPRQVDAGVSFQNWDCERDASIFHRTIIPSKWFRSPGYPYPLLLRDWKI